VLNNDLYYQPLDDDPFRITNNGSDIVTNGKPVSRNEFGIEIGIFWSPNSNYIAFYSENLSEVENYPLLDISTVPATVNNLKYPMSGRKSSSVKIGVYDIENETTIYLNTSDNFDDYLTSVTWSPDSRLLYVAHLNRDQNHLKLVKYNAITGEPIMTLLEEQNDKYIEPEHGLIFVPSDPDQFIWFSERDGWNHMYLYDTFGRLTKQLTQGKWVVKDFLGFDKDYDNVFITGTYDNVLEQQLYRVSLRDESMKKLTLEEGTHNISKHPDFDIFLDEYSNLESPGSAKIIDVIGHTITTVMRSEDPYMGYARGEVKIFSIKGKSDYDLYCKMFYPADFEKFKKYPAIIYVYGGPHKQLVTDSYPEGKYDIWAYRMAQEGYFVFSLDNRGSANRGLAFEQEIFRHLGTAEVEDQLAGVEYLKTLSYIDENRLGVYGWSYGGFMSISLMTRGNGTFKVGVAGGPVTDWSMYEVMYTERYMDTPADNPEGYTESNLMNHAGNLSGKLLVVHGMDDSTVVPEHSLKFLDAAVKSNKPLDYFIYPGYGHHVKGADAIHLYDKIINYFLKNL
jgi:dipeptidyl-peptidase-4